MRKAAKRDSNEGPIVKALRDQGASVVFLSMADAPDLLVGYGGFTLLLEVKEPKGKLRPGQIQWHKDWRGSPVYIVRSIEDAVEVLNHARLRISLRGLPADRDCPAVLHRGCVGYLPPLWW